ncbi:MAG: FixH family protein [Chitinophagales bacterium]
MERINWGWRLGFVYSGFVVFMLFMVYRSTQMKTELVSANYYDEELKYQEHIDAVNRTAHLSAPLAMEVAHGALQLTFPQEVANAHVTAELHWYSPSHQSDDRTMKLTYPEQKEVALSDIKKGRYEVKVDWFAKGRHYYNEKEVTIN